MTLHPQARRAIRDAEASGALPVHHPDYDLVSDRARERLEAAAEHREPVAEVEDVDALGVPCRLYVPGRRPDGRVEGLVVHLHGGGFVLNDVEVHDAAARRLALRSGQAVLSVDYRRPPEHRFPAAPDDVDTVMAWLDEQGAARGLDAPTSVHGDSAGANLALVAALAHPGRFAAVVLIYPFLDPTGSTESYATETAGFDPRTAAWFWSQYAASPADLRDPRLAPLLTPDLRAALARLPPTLVVTAEHDPLRDEGEILARELAEAGVRVTATRYLGQVHGFWRHPAVFDAAEPLMAQVAGLLRAALPT